MIQSILAQLVFYLHYKVTYVNGIIHVIMNPKKQMNSMKNPRSYSLLNFASIFFLFKRFWKQFSNLTESVSIILNDGEASGLLSELFSQLDSLKNYTNIWNGKSSYLNNVKY